VLEAAAFTGFACVLMDVQMPEMDGLQCTASIRERERATRSCLPIIAMTAHAMIGDEATCLAAGMDAYLSKPILPDELYEMVDRYLDTSSHARRAAFRGTPLAADGIPAGPRPPKTVS